MKLTALRFIILSLITLVINNSYPQKIIKLQKVNGVFNIPCKVNGILMNFIFDTGASDVSISLTEAKFLEKQGLLSAEDYIGKVKYRIANGDIEEGSKIILKKVSIEGLILENVEASVVNNLKAPLLLGLSAISKLGKVVFEDDKLVIYPNNLKIETVEEKVDEEENNLKEVRDVFAQIFEALKTNNSKYIKKKYEHLFQTHWYDSVLEKEKAKQPNFADTLYSFGFEELRIFANYRDVNWKNVDTSSIKLEIDTNTNKILIFFYTNNDAYVIQTWYETNSLDSSDYLHFPSRFETYRVFRYGQEIQKIKLEKDENKINELEYYNKCIKYLETKSYLNKEKDYDFFYEFDYTQPKLLYILRAEHLLYNSDYFNAMLDFNKVIEIENILHLSKGYIKENKGFYTWNHDLSKAYLNRGICKIYLEDFQSAIMDFDKYISLDPLHFNDKVYYERGCAKLFLKNHTSALQDFDRYISINTKEGLAYFFRGLTKLKLKNKKGACLDWSKAGELGVKEAYEKIKEYCQQ